MEREQQAQELDPSRTEQVVFAADELEPDVHADADELVTLSIEEAPRPWRVAEALKTLRAQVDAAVPGRSKASDGTIGDPAHQSRASDHNPWVVDGGKGVVTALDVTHDPAHGCDAGRLADTLRLSRDPRIKYIISNRRIASSVAKGSAPAWTWRAYTGTNPHNKHCHISVQSAKAQFDSTTPWAIAPAFGAGLEATKADDGPDEQKSLTEIELAIGALAAAASSEGSGPLLVRLTALQEGAEALLSRYSEALRAPAAEETALEATAPSFDDLKQSNEALFASCTIPASQAGVVAWHRKMLLRGRSRYEEASTKTGVPWWFIGIVHAMEASFNFQGHLHNGDPLARRTVQVPKGRPPVWNPPSDWLSSAVDALQFEKFTGLTDWSVARALYRWEAYNGWGYRRKGINSPYVWSFSNHYTKGKFVKDGVFDPNAVSKQCGTAVMLKALQNAGDVTL